MVVFRRLIGPLLILFALSACDRAPEAPSDIRQAAAAIKGTTSSRMLSRSAFYVAFPNGKPSDYVRYAFSTMGSAEMPYAFDEFEAEQMRAIGQSVFPPTVTLLPHSRDPNIDRQLVLTGNDERGVLIVRGYVQGTVEPVLEKEWALPQVSPAPGVREMFEGNMQMGMDAGY